MFVLLGNRKLRFCDGGSKFSPAMLIKSDYRIGAVTSRFFDQVSR